MGLRSDDIRCELVKEEKELSEIRTIVKRMKENIVDKTPGYFSMRDIINAFFGSIIMGTMSNGFAFLGIPPLYQNVMEGIIVVAAVFWDTKSKSLRK